MFTLGERKYVHESFVHWATAINVSDTEAPTEHVWTNLIYIQQWTTGNNLATNGCIQTFFLTINTRYSYSAVNIFAKSAHHFDELKEQKFGTMFTEHLSSWSLYFFSFSQTDQLQTQLFSTIQLLFVHVFNNSNALHFHFEPWIFIKKCPNGIRYLTVHQ